jgi:acetoin utilization deacetylase AcuC-like enzyme
VLEANHSESSIRLKIIMRRLNSTGLLDDLIQILPNTTNTKYIELIHSTKHINLVKAQANNYKICYQAVSGVLTAGKCSATHNKFWSPLTKIESFTATAILPQTSSSPACFTKHHSVRFVT